MQTSEIWPKLILARQEYDATVSAAYDEVLLEVIARIAASGTVGKSDIGVLLFWKRLRADTTWVRALSSKSDREVRQQTAKAVDAVRDETLDLPEAARNGRGALSKLPGFAQGDALASAVLFAAAPERMAVYDKRSQAALNLLGVELTPESGRYSRYMTILQELLLGRPDDAAGWTPRDIDIALFQLGKPSAR